MELLRTKCLSMCRDFEGLECSVATSGGIRSNTRERRFVRRLISVWLAIHRLTLLGQLLHIQPYEEQVLLGLRHQYGNLVCLGNNSSPNLQRMEDWTRSLLICLSVIVVSTSGDVCPESQSQGIPHLCALSHAMDSSESPLIRHLLTSWWPAWQPTCLIHILVLTHVYRH